MIIEIPNLLNQEDIAYIKEKVAPFVGVKPTFGYNRDGDSVYISQVPELKELDDKLFSIFSNIQSNIVKQRYKPMFDSCDSGYEYHRYGVGDICHYHHDGEVIENFDKSEVNIRYASVAIHLNTIENGGELIFPEQNKKIKTEAGKVVIFPPYAMYGHYTTPADEPREILVTWFLYKNLKVIPK